MLTADSLYDGIQATPSEIKPLWWRYKAMDKQRGGITNSRLDDLIKGGLMVMATHLP